MLRQMSKQTIRVIQVALHLGHCGLCYRGDWEVCLVGEAEATAVGRQRHSQRKLRSQQQNLRHQLCRQWLFQSDQI